MKSIFTGRGAKTSSGLFELVRDERNARGHNVVPALVGHEARATALGAVRLTATRWQIAAPNGDTRAFDLVPVCRQKWPLEA